jgi:MFS family permease
MPTTHRPGWYIVGVLSVCYTLSFVDRQIMGFLVAPIRRDLGISDTQIGLLGGLAFALFYTLVGIPMGVVADRLNRRNLIATGVVFWSAATAACALARTFSSLFAARVGVGIGEATLAPAAMSLVSDLFPKEKLASALGVYAMGIMIGSGLASIVGGLVVQLVTTRPEATLPLVGEIAAWRMAFLIVALPGVVVPWLLFTFREPARKGSLRAADGSLTNMRMNEIVRQINHRRMPVLLVSIGLGCNAMIGYAVAFWGPPLFLRVHGWTPANTGIGLGVVTIVCGCAGLWAGGRLCERLFASMRHDAPVIVAALGVALAGLFSSVASIMPTGTSTLMTMAPGLFFNGLPIGAAYAALQLIFPNQVRGVVSAVHVFLVNLLGLTLGPLLPGLLNDRLFRDGQQVGSSIALSALAAGIVGTISFLATRRAYSHHYAVTHSLGPAADYLVPGAIVRK